MPPPEGHDLLGFARDLVTCRPELRTIVDGVLENTYVVRELSVAERLWSGKTLPAPIVTLDGELLHPHGWLRGGRGGKPSEKAASHESSILSRERDLRQLPAELDRLASVIAELQARYERTRAIQAERTARAEAIRKEIQRAEAHAQELARAVTVLQREQERAHSELRLTEAVAEQMAAEVRGIEQEVVATAARVTEQEEAQRDAAERVDAIQAEVDELVARNRSQQEELARVRTAAALQQQEAKTLTQRAEQIGAQTREIELQMTRRSSRLDALRLQRETLTESVTAQESNLAQLRERTSTLGAELHERDQRQAESERQAHELERGQSAERQELVRLEGDYRRTLVDAQRARDAIEALAQQIREELAGDDDADPLEAIVGAPPSDAADTQDAPHADSAQGEPALTPEEAARLRRQIDQLRNRIKHLGGYDPEAPQQYEELKTRYEFLTGQVRDMEQASANLRAVILELDTTMRRQFEETFHAVNERFQRHFTTLFSGGAARLELTAPRRPAAEDDDDDESEAKVPAKGVGVGGVEVYVQIPGKKVQDLSLLSGGERAMVSAALLFALLETNPPPFCLLDEVDAALDEANVVRFCEILKILAQRTQFIVITHNRVTMTHADAIYGISMGGDSVSRVLSMRLAEVTAAR
jgi:chromosome segregation protein